MAIHSKRNDDYLHYQTVDRVLAVMWTGRRYAEKALTATVRLNHAPIGCCKFIRESETRIQTRDTYFPNFLPNLGAFDPFFPAEPDFRPQSLRKDTANFLEHVF